MIPVVRCRCSWFAFKISIHFGQLRNDTQYQQWPDQHMKRFLQVLLLLSYANTRIIPNEDTSAGNIPGLTTCVETHPSPPHGGLQNSVCLPGRTFQVILIVALIQKFAVVLFNQNKKKKKIIWVLYAQLKTSWQIILFLRLPPFCLRALEVLWGVLGFYCLVL